MQNRYPLWKYILVLVLTVLGVLYSLPNLYGEDPAIQISPAQSSVQVTSATQQQSLAEMAKVSIKPKSIESTPTQLMFRFKNTDDQLKSQDILKASLGENYIVAINIAPATPRWLEWIGAYPMKYGLDLRGGVHFLMDVDIDSVVERRQTGMVKNIAQELRQARVRYSDLRANKQTGMITIRFRDDESRKKAFSTIRPLYPDVLLTNVGQANEYLLQASFTPEALNTLRQNTIEQTMSILRNRVNELGVGEAVVQQQGANRVAVDLPGIQNSAQAKQIVGGTATLEFHMVDTDHDAGAAQNGVVPLGSKLYYLDKTPMLLFNQVVLSGDSITQASASFDERTAKPAVNIVLGGGGETLFHQTTRANIGKPMAIVFVESKVVEKMVNGVPTKETVKSERIISAPRIQGALGNNFQITGLSSVDESRTLSMLLRSGALPAAITPVEERTVGPSLGLDNIRRGMQSLEVGLGLILFIMLVYYRVFGLIANIALVLNVVLLVAILSLLGMTLTLPGLAGIVLTVGMAVDANVLIYERIREELRLGVTPQAAIFAGYERAFSTIVDANVSSLIVVIILYAIGTGPIRGFAVTTSFGLLTSMITGVMFTRALVNLIYGRKTAPKLSIGI